MFWSKPASTEEQHRRLAAKAAKIEAKPVGLEESIKLIKVLSSYVESYGYETRPSQHKSFHSTDYFEAKDFRGKWLRIRGRLAHTTHWLVINELKIGLEGLPRAQVEFLSELAEGPNIPEDILKAYQQIMSEVRPEEESTPPKVLTKSHHIDTGKRLINLNVIQDSTGDGPMGDRISSSVVFLYSIDEYQGAVSISYTSVERAIEVFNLVGNSSELDAVVKDLVAEDIVEKNSGQ